jgi:DeoR family fructose operon transcriptional repressor
LVLDINKKMSSKKLPAAARHATIRKELAEVSAISISEMAVRLGVSEMTIRRDLETLEETSDVRRTHGGAVVAERVAFEFNYQSRQRAHQQQKRAIAEAARKLVQPGDRIILDTGTTTFQLAMLLKDCDGCTIITPSLAVASELQFCENLNVVLLGGVIHKGSPDLTGPVTMHCLDLFSVDWLFQGAEAVGPDGAVYNFDLQLAEVDKKMREKAARRCLLADSSKFGNTALVRTGTIADFDMVFSNITMPAPSLKLVRKLARKLILV